MNFLDELRLLAIYAPEVVNEMLGRIVLACITGYLIGWWLISG